MAAPFRPNSSIDLTGLRAGPKPARMTIQNRFDITRRQALAGFGIASAAVLTGCTATGRTIASSAGAPTADSFLDTIGYNLLTHEPERATSLGVDTGAHAALRGQLKDLSPRA